MGSASVVERVLCLDAGGGGGADVCVWVSGRRMNVCPLEEGGFRDSWERVSRFLQLTSEEGR